MTVLFEGAFQDNSQNYPGATTAGAALGTKIGPYRSEIRSERIFRMTDPNPPAGVAAAPIFEYRVRDEDTGDGGNEHPRAQLTGPKNIPLGEYVFSVFTMWMPTDFPVKISSPTGSTFLNHHGVTGAPYTGIPISVRAIAGPYFFGPSGEVSSGVFDYVSKVSRTSIVGKWVRAIERRRVSADPTIGSIEWWVDFNDGNGPIKQPVRASTLGTATVWIGKANNQIDDPAANARLVLHRKNDLTEAGNNRVTTLRYGGHRICTTWEEAIAPMYPFLSGAAAPVVPGSKLHTLTDDFAASGIDTVNKWKRTSSSGVGNPGGRVEVIGSGGTAERNLATAFGDFDPTDSFVAATVDRGTIAGVIGAPRIYLDTTFAKWVTFNVFADANGVLQMLMGEFLNGTAQGATRTIAYDAAAHVRRRIRHAAGVWYWETWSGTSWVQQHSVTATGTIDSASVTFRLPASATGSMFVDDVNVGAGIGTATTPPSLTHLLGPPSRTISTTAEFEWALGGGAPTTYRTRLITGGVLNEDGTVTGGTAGPYEALAAGATTKVYTGLALDTYRFELEASNAGGGDILAYDWRVSSQRKAPAPPVMTAAGDGFVAIAWSSGDLPELTSTDNWQVYVNDALVVGDLANNLRSHTITGLTNDATVGVRVSYGPPPPAPSSQRSAWSSPAVPMAATTDTGGGVTFSFNPPRLEIGANAAGTSFPVDLIVTGTGSTAWQVVETSPWLSVTPTSGTGSKRLTVTISRTGLPKGRHQAFIDILPA